MAAPAPAHPTEIEAAVREVLSREELRASQRPAGVETQAIGELMSALQGAIDAMLGDLRANHPAVIVVVLLLALAVLTFAAVMGARVLLRRGAASARVPSALPPLLRGDPASLRAEAEREAARGNYPTAVRLLFRAAVIGRALEEGLLDRPERAEAFRRARTHRELVGELWRAHADAGAARALAGRIEASLYRGAELGEADLLAAKELAP